MDEFLSATNRLLTQQHAWYKVEKLPEQSQYCFDQAVNNIASVKGLLDRLLHEMSSLQEEGQKCDLLMKQLSDIIDEGIKSAEKLNQLRGHQKSSSDAQALIDSYEVSLFEFSCCYNKKIKI